MFRKLLSLSIHNVPINLRFTPPLPFLLQLTHAGDANAVDEAEEVGFVLQRMIELVGVPLRDGQHGEFGVVEVHMA